MRTTLNKQFWIILIGLSLISASYVPYQSHERESISFSEDEFIGNQRVVKVLDLQIKPNTLYSELDFGFTYTSFVMEVPWNSEFNDVVYKSSNRSYRLDSIPIVDQPTTARRSPFIITNQPENRFTFFSGDIDGTVRLFLLYAPPVELAHPKRLKKSSQWCDMPDVIPGSTWREGLPDPIGPRSSHTVNHCIIHHSAGSNTRTDYTNVVRNIYLLHTQTNGWDDIGYNFLIAQDGSIYEGRDPQGAGDIDDIKGAHFCGKNTGTMGICLLGNYEETLPKDTVLTSLKHLLVWKCDKDNIDPLGSSRHPEANSNYLDHISGHQDGCATKCPGDSVYPRISDLRKEVDSLLNTCSSSGMYTTTSSNTYWFESRDGTITIKSDRVFESVIVYDVRGQLAHQTGPNFTGQTLDLKDLKPGYYIVQVQFKSGKHLSMRLLVTDR